MKKYKFDFIDKDKKSLQVFYLDKDEKISNLFKAKYLAKNILSFCDCKIKGSSFQLDNGEICCCKCEKELTTKLNDLYKIIVTIEK